MQRNSSFLWILPLTLAWFLAPLQAQVTCNQEALSKAKQEFRSLHDLRAQAPELVSVEEFRAVSQRYVAFSEDCYRALYGSHPFEGHPIDTGGLWAGGIRPRHNLDGRKWGAGSQFAGGQDATGPRSPGGQVSYSYMANGVVIGNDAGTGASCAPACTNTSVFSFGFTDSGGDTDQARCLQREIGQAFAAWSAVADITFVPVADNGAAFDAAGAAGSIRIGFHPIDGALGILAHAFFPPPNGVSAAGDIHFDLAEGWSCENLSGSIDISLVALHEIGHSIGLRHETAGDTAVMNASYNPALSFGPVADDIIGVGEIYGGSPLGGHTFFGRVGFGTDQPLRALHLAGNSDDTMILINNRNTAVSTRLLLDMRNNGGAGFRFENRNRSSSWGVYLNDAVTPAFALSRLGTGIFEFLFEEDGDLIIQGNLTQLSDESAKENLVPVDGLDVLQKVQQLPLFHWNYRHDEEKELHVGPTAQDFHALFNLGRDERHIAPADTSGIALASVQGLYQLLQEQQAQIEALRTEVEALRQRLAPPAPGQGSN